MLNGLVIGMAQPPASAAGDEVAASMRELGLRNADRCGACGAAASLLGSTCRFCRARFCLKHAQAEAHGCGSDAAKTERCASLVSCAHGTAFPCALASADATCACELR